MFAERIEEAEPLLDREDLMGHVGPAYADLIFQATKLHCQSYGGRDLPTERAFIELVESRALSRKPYGEFRGLQVLAEDYAHSKRLIQP